MTPFPEKQRSEIAKLITQWWQSLQPNEAGQDKTGQFAMLGRADRAQLRHCKTADEALLLSCVHRLSRALNRLDGVDIDLSALALAAAVIAHATDHQPKKYFANSLGTINTAGRVPMSELRFQQLQTCCSESDFFRHARRALALLGGVVNVGECACDLLQWVAEFRASDSTLLPQKKRLKLRWASGYYDAILDSEAP